MDIFKIQKRNLSQYVSLYAAWVYGNCNILYLKCDLDYDLHNKYMNEKNGQLEFTHFGLSISVKSLH